MSATASPTISARTLAALAFLTVPAFMAVQDALFAFARSLLDGGIRWNGITVALLVIASWATTIRLLLTHGGRHRWPTAAALGVATTLSVVAAPGMTTRLGRLTGPGALDPLAVLIGGPASIAGLATYFGSVAIGGWLLLRPGPDRPVAPPWRRAATWLVVLWLLQGAPHVVFAALGIRYPTEPAAWVGALALPGVFTLLAVATVAVGAARAAPLALIWPTAMLLAYVAWALQKAALTGLAVASDGLWDPDGLAGTNLVTFAGALIVAPGIWAMFAATFAAAAADVVRGASWRKPR